MHFIGGTFAYFNLLSYTSNIGFKIQIGYDGTLFKVVPIAS